MFCFIAKKAVAWTRRPGDNHSSVPSYSVNPESCVQGSKRLTGTVSAASSNITLSSTPSEKTTARFSGIERVVSRAVDGNQTKGERFAFARVWKKLVERIDAVAQNGHGIRFERAVFVGRFGGVIDQRMRFGGNAIGFGERFAVKRIARDGGQRAIPGCLTKR